MEELDDLASAAHQAWKRPYPPRSSSKPIVITVVIVIALLGALAAILRFAPRSAPPPPAVVAAPVDPSIAEAQAAAREAGQARAVHAALTSFSQRLAASLAKEQRATLQASVDTGVVYNCSYQVRRTEVKKPKAPNSLRECVITFSSTLDWSDEENNSAADTYEITATFVQDNSRWKNINANSKLLTHKASAGLFGDSAKVGTVRDLGSAGWFTAAVADAQ